MARLRLAKSRLRRLLACTAPAGASRLHFLPWGKKIEVLPPSSWRQATVHRTVAYNLSSLCPFYAKNGNDKKSFPFFGPSGETRTRGILLPKQARYQLRYTWMHPVLYTTKREKAIRKTKMNEQKFFQKVKLPIGLIILLDTV